MNMRKKGTKVQIAGFKGQLNWTVTSEDYINRIVEAALMLKDAEALSKLANHDDYRVRRAVINNKHTYLSTLHALTKDSSDLIKDAAYDRIDEIEAAAEEQRQIRLESRKAARQQRGA
jgi:hypothetical protein